METPIYTGRDPVCEAIESLLEDLQAKGKGSFIRTGKRVAFGEISAEAETYDIALVRLASAMMDDERYNVLLLETLREANEWSNEQIRRATERLG